MYFPEINVDSYFLFNLPKSVASNICIIWDEWGGINIISIFPPSIKKLLISSLVWAEQLSVIMTHFAFDFKLFSFGLSKGTKSCTCCGNCGKERHVMNFRIFSPLWFYCTTFLMKTDFCLLFLGRLEKLVSSKLRIKHEGGESASILLIDSM